MIDAMSAVLTVIGIFSLVGTILRAILVFSKDNCLWIDNISIKEFPLSEDFENCEGFYPFFYTLLQDPRYGSRNLIKPENTILRNVKLQENKEINKKPKFKTIHKFKEITPDRPLVIALNREGCFVRYRLKWSVDYGATAYYEFNDNCRNGDNSSYGIKYHFGFVAKIRKILDLR